MNMDGLRPLLVDYELFTWNLSPVQNLCGSGQHNIGLYLLF